MIDKYPTTRRDFLKTSLISGAAALAVWELPAAHAATDAPAAQTPFVPTDPANAPMGVAFGIKPGRVAWAFDPKEQAGTA